MLPKIRGKLHGPHQNGNKSLVFLKSELRRNGWN